MVRAPCCQKMGLKKGPWTPEEDQILINYINHYGHGNWRALPKQAGLLRCGKSCRLRWTNYLRPDIKRGNFTKKEEDTIIELHETLGNKWSAIAAKLPGRTDNEIKNVWHTHLKKRLLKKQNQSSTDETKKVVSSTSSSTRSSKHDKKKRHANMNSPSPKLRPTSPQYSSSGISSVTNDHNEHTDDININCQDNNNNANNECVKKEASASFIDMDEDFWSEVLSADNSSMAANEFQKFVGGDTLFGLPSSSLPIMDSMKDNNCSVMSDNVDFWFDLFTRAGELTELPHFD